MRLKGYTPADVHVDIEPSWTWRDWPQWTNHAQVLIEDRDSVALLDLRFLVGLMVFVQGNDRARVQAVASACAAAKAARVIAALDDGEFWEESCTC
jgi:hypothetical protein